MDTSNLHFYTIGAKSLSAYFLHKISILDFFVRYRKEKKYMNRINTEFRKISINLEHYLQRL